MGLDAGAAAQPPLVAKTHIKVHDCDVHLNMLKSNLGTHNIAPSYIIIII